MFITTPSGTASFLDTFTVRNVSAKVETNPPNAIPDVEQTPLKTGYVIVTPDSQSRAPSASLTFGLIQNAAVISQSTVVPASVASTAVVPVDIMSGFGRNTGFAAVNLIGQSNQITLTLLDPVGTAPSNSIALSLQPYQQLTRFITELFPSGTTDPYFRGSVLLQSGGPFAAVALRFIDSVFTTVYLSATSPAALPVRALSGGSVGGTKAIVFPQFVLGGGWASQIVLDEINGTATSGRIDIFDSNGQPLSVKLNGQTNSTFIYTIPAGGTFVLVPRDENGQPPL
jgi:hypothetical protein